MQFYRLRIWFFFRFFFKSKSLVFLSLYLPKSQLCKHYRGWCSQIFWDCEALDSVVGVPPTSLSPSSPGVWMVTMVTQSWVQVATVGPVFALTGHRVDVSFLTAVTFWQTPTSWCVCAAQATKVYKHTQWLVLKFLFLCKQLFCTQSITFCNMHMRSLIPCISDAL